MTVKVTMPNNSSDSVDFINATGTTLAQVKAYDDGSSNGHLELYTTASGTSAERVRVTSAGNVGIGTSSPSAKLHVYDTSATSYINNRVQGDNVIFNMSIGNSNVGTASFRNLAYLGTQNSYPLAFVTGDTERARIDTSGNVGIGTSSPSQKLHVSGGLLQVTRNTQNMFLNPDYNSGGTTSSLTVDTGKVLAFMQADTERARIDTSGNLLVGTTSGTGERIAVVGASGFATSSFRVSSNGNPNINFRNDTGTVAGSITTGASTTAYNTSSDYRLKENIAPMAGALTTVAQLKPVTYTWKVDGTTGQGFIAHELQEVCPDAVTGEKDAVDADGNPQYQGIDTSFLVATLTAAIQELSAKNDALEARLAALENK